MIVSNVPIRNGKSTLRGSRDYIYIPHRPQFEVNSFLWYCVHIVFHCSRQNIFQVQCVYRGISSRYRTASIRNHKPHTHRSLWRDESPICLHSSSSTLVSQLYKPFFGCLRLNNKWPHLIVSNHTNRMSHSLSLCLYSISVLARNCCRRMRLRHGKSIWLHRLRQD